MKSNRFSLPSVLVKVTFACLVATDMARSPKVFARSPSNSNENSQLSPGDLPSFKSPIERIIDGLKVFDSDGTPDAKNQVGGGTYVQNSPGFEEDGRPGNATSQGSRSNCPAINLPLDLALSALIPKTNLGKTVDGHPTFWFYIPYPARVIQKAEFMLLDENQNPVWEQTLSIPLSGTPGLVNVTLPATVKELEIDREYHWFFELQCNSENPSSNPRVDGWVKRVAPIPGIEPNDYIAYTEQGIWYNALTSLIQMRQQDMQNPTRQQDWEALLKAVGLESLIDVPLSNCCSQVESVHGSERVNGI